jgi:hypothetical protein
MSPFLQRTTRRSESSNRRGRTSAKPCARSDVGFDAHVHTIGHARVRQNGFEQTKRNGIRWRIVDRSCRRCFDDWHFETNATSIEWFDDRSHA